MKEWQKAGKPTGFSVSDIPAQFRDTSGVIQTRSNSTRLNIFSNLYLMFQSADSWIIRQL